MTDERAATAIDLMMRFANRTGIAAGKSRRRYLWTDAFAVCNFLALERATRDSRYGAHALHLVDQVHHELGRFRPDDPRSGWISGLGEPDGEMHPTFGGLRIGKPLPERSSSEPFDTQREWDRDGQYFHYLTKWAHALGQVAGATRDVRYHRWSRELMRTAHHAFSHGPPQQRRMVWKLSTDLSRPLVSSMGQHDPLDGLVTCVDLDASANEFGFPKTPMIADAIDDFAKMLGPTELATTDPLGLGGLLFDACRLVRIEPVNHPLLAAVLRAAVTGLAEYAAISDLRATATRRLAFRELGLAIGLAGVSMLRKEAVTDRLDDRAKHAIDQLARYEHLRGAIERFWMSSDNRTGPTWLDHEDINEVMLATSLTPDGFLTRPSRDRPKTPIATIAS